VARNRKRRSDRRPDRAEGQASPQPGLATANGPWRGEEPTDQAPDPIQHATPDVELAEAQLAVGRDPMADDEAPLTDEELLEAEEAEEAQSGRGGGNGRGGSRRLGAGGSGDPGRGAGAGTAIAPGAELTPARSGSRVVHFVQGSWRELQRVQWPDRRQVIQATGVVIGFVIVAGVFLGVADLVAQKIVNLLLK
jgi:preprotein translocase subunit SecE